MILLQHFSMTAFLKGWLCFASFFELIKHGPLHKFIRMANADKSTANVNCSLQFLPKPVFSNKVKNCCHRNIEIKTSVDISQVLL